MKRANAREAEDRQRDRFASPFVIADHRCRTLDQGMTADVPILSFRAVADSVSLATLILKRVMSR